MQTPPRALGRTPQMETIPPMQTPPQYINKRAVRIVLECILVIVKYFILQPRQTISLNKLESHEIRTFPEVKWKQFVFLDYTKKVALFGKETKGAEPGVHIFALEGGRYKELIDQRLPAPCTHQYSVEMTSLSLGTLGYSYLIFTCYACKDIKMVDVDHKKTYVVHSSGYRYNRFCAGGEDAVFVYNFGDPFEVRLCACSWACVIRGKVLRMLMMLASSTCSTSCNLWNFTLSFQQQQL